MAAMARASSARSASGSRSDGRQVRVLDVVFVAVVLMFFAVSVGYVGLCDRLMK